MKKALFIIVFSLSVHLIFANGSEQVCVVTNSGSTGQACTPSELGPVAPCSTLSFIVTYLTPPTGYVLVGKFEWFINGVLVKTTTDASDPILNLVVESNTINAYCKVTYKKLDGTLSSPYTSTTFTPIVKQLNFDPSIVTSAPSPNYGCTNKSAIA